MSYLISPKPASLRRRPDHAANPDMHHFAEREDGAKARQEQKRARRAQREQELAAATKAASQVLGHEVYGVIYADPAWRFEPFSRDTGMDRAADNHYPTMRLDDIKALPIPAAKNCVLFLWATAPMLPDGGMGLQIQE
jgi:hypothetical protein